MAVRRRWIWISLGIAGALALGSIADARGFRRYLELQKDVEELESRNQELSVQNERMMREVEALRKDRAAMERAAREELGFVRPGELVLNVE